MTPRRSLGPIVGQRRAPIFLLTFLSPPLRFSYHFAAHAAHRERSLKFESRARTQTHVQIAHTLKVDLVVEWGGGGGNSSRPVFTLSVASPTEKPVVLRGEGTAARARFCRPKTCGRSPA